jgi:hypothetical protein
MTKNHIKQLPSWPATLVKNMPGLLVKLLEQKTGESLERLQLIDIDIKVLPKADSKAPSLWEKVAMDRSSEGRDNFLSLQGHLAGPEPLVVQVKYFVRGARKFYRPDVAISSGLSPSPWLAIEREWVIKNLKDYGQENSSFTEQALAQLNGRQEVQVPSHLLLGEVLEETLKQWSIEKAELTHFVVRFLAGVSLSRHLSRGISVSDRGVEGMIFSEGDPVIAFEGSCS